MNFYFTQFSFQTSCVSLYTFLTFWELTLFAVYLPGCSAGCNGGASNRYRCMVTSPSGTYRGLFNASVLNPHSKYCSFRDVPYGEPPVGNRRFGVPVLRKSLPKNVIYDATQDRYRCPQSGLSNPNPSPSTNEDCLYLNVFTPYYGEHSYGTSLLPVIVWVHGGAFNSGSKKSSEFAPDYFMTRGVVLVTINYRLGSIGKYVYLLPSEPCRPFIFGFLDLNIPEAPGNLGIRDQILALEWVQKNIRNFGGDPKRVTSMGQSAGAVSVGLQFLSPRSLGMINRIIIESGPSPLLSSNSSTTVNNSIRFAVFLGYKGNIKDRLGMLHYLQGLNASRLVDGYYSYQNKTGLMLGPTQDYDGPCPLFPDSEENLGARAPNIPCIMGYNSADGTAIFNGGNPYATVNRTLANLGSQLSRVDPIFAKDNRTLEKVVEKVLAYFYNPRDKSSQIDKTVKFLSYLFNRNFYNLVRTFRASYVNKNIWIYYFDYGGGYSDYKKLLIGPAYAGEVSGASHSEELRYMFYAPQFSPNGFQATKRELVLIERMTTWWSNLARNGSPNNNCDSIGVDWYPITPFQDDYLWIQNSSEPVFVKDQKINSRTRKFFRYLKEFARNYQPAQTQNAAYFHDFYALPINFQFIP